MDFTREPIIETIITPREGFKLVVRSSKSLGQEEYFVEAVEIVSFGHALFYRSLERPKCFMVPVTDYEILEVREARMVLKNVGVDSTIKIGGGREGRVRTPTRELTERSESEDVADRPAVKSASGTEVRPERKRERRRNSRRRRGGREERVEGKEGAEGDDFRHAAGEGSQEGDDRIDLAPARSEEVRERRNEPGAILSAILPPPTQLISETLERYREDELFRGVFQSSAPAAKTEEATVEDIQTELLHHNPDSNDENFAPLTEAPQLAVPVEEDVSQEFASFHDEEEHPH